MELKKYWNNLKKQLPYISRTLKLIRQASGNLLFVWFFLIIIQGFLPALFIFIVKPLVNKLTELSHNHIELGDAIRTILPELTLLALVLILTEGLKSIIRWVRSYQGELVQDYIKKIIHQKALQLDISFFENSEYYNKLYQARIDSLSKPIALLENLGTLAQNSITFIAIISILIIYKWWILPLIIISALPLFFVLLMHTFRFHQWRIKAIIEERKTNYYDYLLTERESAAEIRLFNLGEYFQNLFNTTRTKLRNEYFKLNKNQVIYELLAIIWGLITVGFIMAYMLIHTLQGVISLGVLTMFYVAFNQCQKVMNSLVSSATEIYKNIIFIENLFEFLEIQSLIKDVNTNSLTEFKINKSIFFKDVTFSYPSSDRIVLKNFNMEIQAGKITAIVGTNGAGKSTLIKLLCRFYDPTDGSIEVDGINLNNFSPELIHENITVLFQEFMRFHLSAKDNIALGNIHNSDTDEIENAAKNSGANDSIEKLPKKYNTMLGRWFSGSELSGGEWQRVALARAFLRKAELIILDEPTSAMDSWAETDWIQRFKNLVNNVFSQSDNAKSKTALIITHRFTTAMQADIIYVMHNGEVIENGTHHELMAFNGEYAKSWLTQTKQVNLK